MLVATLALSARAGVVSPAGPVFAPPAGAWTGPLGVAFADPLVSPFLPPGLGSLSLTSPEAMRSAAPLVQSLTQALAVTPQAFAAMSPTDQKGAIELAVEDAKDSVRIKAYELSETARALSKPDRAMDKEGRAELYGAVARLMEMRDYYGPWLDEHAKAALDESYDLASARAWEVRTFLLERDAPSLSVRPERAAAPTAPVYVLKPSGTAVKMRADMENNKSGWGQDDLDTIYTGYDFTLRQGGKHRMYTHPFFSQLHQSVSRQNDLPPGYAQSALKLIAELERLTALQRQTAAAPATGPPATLRLDDLAILLSQPKEKAPKHEPVRVEKSRAPPAVARRPAEKTVPDAPLPPKITAQLAPSQPKAAELKPEPPPVKTDPRKPAGFIERVKGAWGKIGFKPN